MIANVSEGEVETRNEKPALQSPFTWLLALVLSAGGCGGGGGGSGGGGSNGGGTRATVSVSGFSPASGAPGTAVSITGSGFDAIAANNTVKFNGVTASVSSATTTQIVVSVPQNATTGPITVSNSNGSGVSGGYFSVIALAPPVAPTGLAAASGNAQLTITWSSVPGANSYNLYWATSSGVTKLTGNKLANVTSPYVHAGLTNGTPYYYVVTAVNSAGESAESAQASATPQLLVPAAPSGASATAGNAQNTISWGASSGATSYNLYWSTTAGVTKSNGNKVAGVTSPYTHTGLINGTPYYYVITAVNGAGESADSTQASATPVAPVTAPAAPSGVAAAAGNAKNTISWNASSGATSYNLYWSTTNGVNKSNGNKIAAVTSPYVHTGLSNGAAYYYVVTATNSAGESADSAQVSATPTAQSNVWTSKASMPSARAHARAVSLNGLVYVVGGHNGASSIGDLIAYNPVANSWASKASMTYARHQSAAGVINGILYVAGGYNNGTRSYLEAYDPVANAWSAKASMLTALQGPGAEANGKLYALGGESGGGCTNVVQAYDPATNSWTYQSSMPTPRCHAAAVTVSGLIYVIGGTNTSGSVSYQTVEVYDPVVNSWSTRAPMPTGRSLLGADTVNGVIYAIGGFDHVTGTKLSTVEAYDTATNTWSTKASMSTVRGDIPAVAQHAGVVYAAGGANATSYMSSVEAYTP